MPYSSSDTKLSIVTLTVTGINASANNATISAIHVMIPVGMDSSSLVAAPNADAVAGAPGRTSPWALAYATQSRWFAAPLPPATGVPAGGDVDFVFSNVAINLVAGDPQIQITEVSSVGINTAQVTVRKTTPSEKGDLPPEIRFTASPEQVALSGVTKLSWEVSSAQSAVLQPGGIPIQVPSDSVQLPIAATTIFNIVAFGPGGSARAPCTVTVMPVAILWFTATPRGPVAPGTMVQLSWSTQFSSLTSINRGVGPVMSSGVTTVTPATTTIYTLTANGLNPQTCSVRVEVTPHTNRY